MKRIQHNRHNGGFSRLDVIIVMVVLAVLIALLLPGIAKTRKKTKRINCVNHLKQVGLAFKSWAIDHDDRFPMQISVTNGGTMESELAYIHFQILSNELTSPRVLICTVEKERASASSFGKEFSNEHLSYFANLNANDTNNASFLAGDRNLTLNGSPVGTGLATFTPDDAIGWTSQYHSNWGNILLSDGNVQSWPTARLSSELKRSGVQTNHLAIP